MASEIQICNLALSYLGQSPITNLMNPQNATEQLCALNYKPCRDAVLEAHNWTFAMARATLTTPDVTPPEWGLAYRFQLPTNLLRVVWAGRQQDENYYDTFDWQVEDDYLVTDANPVWIRYVKVIEDASKFSPLFVQALACRLAMDMCVSITENVALYERLVNMFAAKIGEAVNVDALQGRSKRIKQNILRNRR